MTDIRPAKPRRRADFDPPCAQLTGKTWIDVPVPDNTTRTITGRRRTLGIGDRDWAQTLGVHIAGVIDIEYGRVAMTENQIAAAHARLGGAA